MSDRLTGDALRALRAKHCLTIVQAAQEVGVSWRTWTRWENQTGVTELGMFKLEKAGWIHEPGA